MRSLAFIIGSVTARSLAFNCTGGEIPAGSVPYKKEGAGTLEGRNARGTGPRDDWQIKSGVSLQYH